MAHLRKSAATGHLLKNAAGHLVNQCADETTTAAPTTTSPTTTTTSTTSTTAAPTTTTTAAPTTTTEGPANECNSCSPPISDTLQVVLAGLGGNFGSLNGTHDAQWISGCFWRAGSGAKSVSVWFQASTGFWYVEIGAGTGCYKRWRNGSANCDPDGVYSEETCSDSGCLYPRTCEYSEGATCSVSEV